MALGPFKGLLKPIKNASKIRKIYYSRVYSSIYFIGNPTRLFTVHVDDTLESFRKRLHDSNSIPTFIPPENYKFISPDGNTIDNPKTFRELGIEHKHTLEMVGEYCHYYSESRTKEPK
jgi:hypothetical protein